VWAAFWAIYCRCAPWQTCEGLLRAPHAQPAGLGAPQLFFIRFSLGCGSTIPAGPGTPKYFGNQPDWGVWRQRAFGRTAEMRWSILLIACTLTYSGSAGALTLAPWAATRCRSPLRQLHNSRLETPSTLPVPPPSANPHRALPLTVVVPLVLSTSVLSGALVYQNLDESWSFAWAFYFAVQAVFGVMYNNLQTSEFGEGFTLFLYIFGSAVCASAVGSFVSQTMAEVGVVASNERRKHRAKTGPAVDGLIETIDSLGIFHASSRRALALACSAWICLGVTTTMLVKHVSLLKAVQIALGAVSGAGFPAPPSDPALFGDAESLALALYIVAGVPLFVASIGQLSLGVVESAVRQGERQLMERPLSDSELALVQSLHEHTRRSQGGEEIGEELAQDPHIDLSDFIVMELLRLQRIDEDELVDITSLFDRLNAGGDTLRQGRKRLQTSSALDHLQRRKQNRDSF